MESEPLDKDLTRVLGLWRAEDSSDDQSEIEPNALAAYLEGTLAADDLEELEQQLAANPGALELALAARAAMEEPAAAVPLGLTRRARALREAAVGSGSTVLRPQFDGLPLRYRAPAWIGVAAAMVLAVVGSFELGQTGYQLNVEMEGLLADAVDLGSFEQQEDFL